MLLSPRPLLIISIVSFHNRAILRVECRVSYHDVSVDGYCQDVEHWGLSRINVVVKEAYVDASMHYAALENN